MTSRDYTQEIGLPSQKKTMPRALAFTVLAIVAVGISFGIADVLRQARLHAEAEKAVPAAPAAAPAKS